MIPSEFFVIIVSSIIGIIGFLSWIYFIVITIDNSVDRFGTFYASTTFKTPDGYKITLQFYIKYGIKHEIYKKVFKNNYKLDAHERIIKYISDYASKHDNKYSELDLQNSKIRNTIVNDIIHGCNVDGIELINVLPTDNFNIMS